uniref:Actin-related protein 2/3 complex subunit 5 n=1 Tax=Noctiluca scintillans TaxID=2966 RepID=A0A7S1F642_NOCSC
MDEDQLSQNCKTAQRKVEELLRANKRDAALLEALQSPPYESVVDQTKDDAANLVLKVLSYFKEADIKGAACSLEPDLQTTLMKYLYRFWGTGLPARQNAPLFIWHAALVEHAGEGVIVRAIFDVRRP